MFEIFNYRPGLVFKIALVAAIGGLMNGFMTAVIAGMLPILRDEWSLSSNQQEWIVAVAILGAVFGAFISARTVNWLGRRKTILAASVIFAVSSVLCAVVNSLPWLYVSRCLIGIAVGMSSFTIPLYITEISPNRNRTALITLNQLMITIGILFAYVNSLTLLDTEHAWRWMALVGLIPSILLFTGMIFLPGTPKSLILRGRYSQARAALLKIEEPEKVEMMMDMIKEEVEAERTMTTRWRDVLKSKYVPITAISIAVMFIQQCTGVNIFIYYSPMLFEISGFHSLQAELAGAVAIGVTNVLFTVISITLIERFKRKSLYLFGLAGMTVALMTLSFAFNYYSGLGVYLKWIVLGSSLLYVIFFSISIGPLAWLICTEIFPTHMRSVGMSISIMFNWILNLIVIFTFFKVSMVFSPAGNEFIIQQSNRGITDIFFNPGINFFIYGLLAVGGMIMGYYLLPETKGMSDLDIDDFWERNLNKKRNQKARWYE